MKPRPSIKPSILRPRTNCTFSKFQNHHTSIRPAPSSSAAPYSTLKAQHNNTFTHHALPVIPRTPFHISTRSASHAVVKAPFSKLPLPQPLEKLNPPDDTYAPELNVPRKTPDQNRLKYLFQCGRAYIQFYKQGIANVRSTSKLAKTLRKKGGKDLMRNLTRAEWQIVKRSRADMLRLPPFGLIVIVLGEWTPLVALYLTPLIPEACRIPQQIDSKLRKAEARRQERLRRLALDAARLVARDRKPGAPMSPSAVRPAGVRPEDVDQLDYYTLLSLSSRLDAHGALWDRLFITPPKAWLKWGLKAKLEYLKRDDALIRRDGGPGSLGEKELKRACFERGINVVDVGESALRKELAKWFRR
ncbi:hypothetical protein DM02DRAFT_616312 [Periconia macrospinosa]|uniref:Letm1 RBD domain-containing protein n=1 Tax=Periconia macrospinosa TaxID=97972 RepID=A0A2V1DIA7_9PLEO|nr:hypothetical protein DM02DRAFT_616312 [Periconia macrospinosa]